MSAEDIRRRELGMIHIAKAQLGLDEDTYRNMLFTLTRVRSAKELDEHGRRRVLEHLKARGFKPIPGKTPHPGRPHNIEGSDRSAQLKKVEALLADAGRPWSYVDGMVRRMFKVERVAWCNADQLHRLIAALEYDKRRRQGGK